MGRYFRVFIPILVVILFATVAVAELQVYEDDSVTVEGANSKIVWGQNYTFDTSFITVYEDGVEVEPGNNLSVTSNTTDQINSTLWRYDLSGVSSGKTVLKIGSRVVSPVNVRYEFTDVPEIEFGKYQLEIDGDPHQNFSSGGSVTWYHDDWGSDHNFTLVYRNYTSESNAPPTITSLSPGDTNTDYRNGVELEATVGDANSDSLDLTFYDGNSDKIGEVTGVGNGTYSVTWTGLNSDQSYEWEVEVADGSARPVSATSTFTTVDLDLSWTDNSDNEQGFRIYSNRSGSWQRIKTVGTNTEGFKHVSNFLEFGRYICYNVTAYNQYGESDPVQGCKAP